jgi:hypothetical protein
MMLNEPSNRQVHGQLGMPGGGHELIEPIVTIGCREQKGVAFLTFVDLLDGVTNAPVGPVHVTGNDEQDSDRHVVVSDVGHPKASSHRVQTTL